MKIAVSFMLLSTFGYTQKTWEFKDAVLEGNQFDAMVFNNKIYVMAQHYYELDGNATVVYENQEIKDSRQGAMDYDPAIGVSKDGTVHTLTRNGGDWENGHFLQYSKKDSAGNWTVKNQLVAEPVKRNYTVGISALDDGNAYLVHTDPTGQKDIRSLLSFYRATSQEIKPVGQFNTSYSRTDSNFQIRQNNGITYVLTGNPWPIGSIWYFHAPQSVDFVAKLELSKEQISQGTGRKSNPDINFTSDNLGFYSYGTLNSVYYNIIKEDKVVFEEDQLLFSDLGDWHLSSGISAIAALPGGKALMAVAIKSRPELCEGDEACIDRLVKGELIYKYSLDGGIHWSEVKSTGKIINAGEGRSVPKLVGLQDKFFLFCSDSGHVNIGTIIPPHE